MSYADAGESPWRVDGTDFPMDGPVEKQARFLLRYAILAASTYNTQPWLFAVTGDEIRVYADKDRWLRVVDASQRELHISVGCALENLLIAGRAFGFEARVDYLPEPRYPELAAVVVLGRREGFTVNPVLRALFQAITRRHTNHRHYESVPVPAEDLAQLCTDCIAGDGVSLLFRTDPSTRAAVHELATRADVAQFADPAFREELGRWLARDARHGARLLGTLRSLAMHHGVPAGQARPGRPAVPMSAPVLGLLCTLSDERLAQIRVGQALERLYLCSATLGLSLQPISHVVELSETRADLARLMGIGERLPQQPFRLGYAQPESGHTPRRPLAAVLIG